MNNNGFQLTLYKTENSQESSAYFVFFLIFFQNSKPLPYPKPIENDKANETLVLNPK